MQQTAILQAFSVLPDVRRGQGKGTPCLMFSHIYPSRGSGNRGFLAIGD